MNLIANKEASFMSYFALNSNIFQNLRSMPALKMKAKSTTNCKRDSSYPYVSQKSNKVSTVSYPKDQVACEPTDLDTSTQTFQIGESSYLMSTYRIPLKKKKTAVASAESFKISMEH